MVERCEYIELSGKRRRETAASELIKIKLIKAHVIRQPIVFPLKFIYDIWLKDIETRQTYLVFPVTARQNPKK